MKIKDFISHYKRLLLKTPFYILILRFINRIFIGIRDYHDYKKAIKKGTVLLDDAFIKDLKLKRNYELCKDSKLQRLINFSFLNSILSNSEIKFVSSVITKRERKRIMNLANEICDHKFDLLGSGKVKITYGIKPKGVEGYLYNKNIDLKELNNLKKRLKGKIIYLLDFNKNGEDIKYNPIDWHLDFKSGYKWENDKWYKKIVYGKLPGVDVKVPWELSRFQHLVLLGQAYLLTGNEKYSFEYVCQIIDWIENNIPQFGVNWKCTMDISIRAANWVLSLSFFKNSKIITRKFLFYFVKNIYIHGKHIFNNLEYSSITSNHYLSNISGLFFIAKLFSNHNIGKKWLNFSINELKKEIKKQVYKDGVDFEASTCYHRLVLELLFYPLFYSVKGEDEFNGKNFNEVGGNIFGEKFIKKIYKMFEAVLFILKPNGMMPQIGDNDNGRFFIFRNNSILDMRYLLVFGAIFFKESKFKVKEFDFSEEALWIFGKNGLEIWNELENNQISNIESKAFPDAGFYIIRKNENYLISSCGPNGQNGNGGHAHNDKLGFELCINGRDIIIDPGSYLYTPIPELRNRFRSTSFHNTIMIDDQEQNRFKNGNLFSLENDSQVRVINWKISKTHDFIEAEHYGYRRFNNPVIHKRQFIFNKIENFLIIRDILTGKGEHGFDLFLHIGLGNKVEVDCNKLAVNIQSGRRSLKIISLIERKVGLSVERGWYSEFYGSKVKLSTLKYSKSGKLPIDLLLLILFDNHNYSYEYVNEFIERVLGIIND